MTRLRALGWSCRILLVILAAATLFGAQAPTDARRVKVKEVVGDYEGEAASGVSARRYDLFATVNRIQGRRVSVLLSWEDQDSGEVYAEGLLKGTVNSVGIVRLRGQVNVDGQTSRCNMNGFYFVADDEQRMNLSYIFLNQGDRGSCQLFGFGIE